MVVIMETEIWPNLFKACQSRDIPIMIANARISPRSFRGYRFLNPLVTATLRRVLRIATQTETDAARFRALGARPESVAVVGNLKFDLEVNPHEVEEGRGLRRQLGRERAVLIAASTHAGEEEIVLDAFETVRSRFPEALLIVVPRHPERFEKAAQCCRGRGYRIARRSDGRVEGEIDVFVGDTMGEMMCYLAASDVAFVAGSLVPVGGHNVLEPAVLALPVIFGPYMFNFEQPSDTLVEAGAGWRIENGAGLADVVIALFADSSLRARAGAAAQAAVASNRGVLERLTADIQRVLSPESIRANGRVAEYR
jgi:3-deoxy-D-manno-octulosonic-acid transferase